MDRVRQPPINVGKPRRGHYERNHTTPTRTNRTGTTHHLHQYQSTYEDPLNELTDRWADLGRESENIRWSLSTNRPIFSWTKNGKTHQSPTNSTVKRRIDLQAASGQFRKHKVSTVRYLIREICDNSRDLLGKFQKDKGVWIRARRKFLQCIAYQFSCALKLKMWGILKEVKCRICEKHYNEMNMYPPDLVESVGHIQCYCSALQLPRIAVHHGI